MGVSRGKGVIQNVTTSQCQSGQAVQGKELGGGLNLVTVEIHYLSSFREFQLVK